MKTTIYPSILQRAQGGLLGATFLLAWYLFLVSGAAAQETFWVADGIGNWIVAANWSAGVPNEATVVQINNGGTAKLFDPGADARFLTLGYGPGNSGTLEVFGGEAYFRDSLFVGDFGTGALRILNFGRVYSAVGYIGYRSGGTGTGTVDGAASQWVTTNFLVVGYAGNGTLTIQNGGAVSNGLSYLGRDTNSHGTVIVDGENSTWTNSGDLTVGDDGTGALSITSGGRVLNVNALIGLQAGSTGTAAVDGPGSTWTNSGEVLVGVAGDGTLEIRNGGKVSNVRGHVALNPGSSGAVVVSDPGSSWSGSGSFFVGNSGAGSLQVLNGGTASTTGNSYLGSSLGSSGSAVVSGAGAIWTSSLDLAVGVFGAGALSITGGGQVGNANGRIGREAGSTGTVVVDGLDSLWDNTGVLTIGLFNTGTGALELRNRSVVVAAGGMTIGANGTVRGVGRLVAYVLNTGIVAPGSATGTLHVTGNYTQTFGGKLQIELASPASFDKLDVAGNVALDGSTFLGIGSFLEVSLLDGYVPHGSQSFDILDWTGNLSNTFASIQLPTLGGTLVWDTSQLYATGVLTVVGPGFLEADFDENGVVNGADLTNWKAGFGTAGGAVHLQGNADGDQDVDGGDFLVWQRQLGQGELAVAAIAAVPEPISLDLLLAGACLLVTAQRSVGLVTSHRALPLILQLAI